MPSGPKPPEGYETWLDAILTEEGGIFAEFVHPLRHARAELAALREKDDLFSRRMKLESERYEALLLEVGAYKIDAEKWRAMDPGFTRMAEIHIAENPEYKDTNDAEVSQKTSSD